MATGRPVTGTILNPDLSLVVNQWIYIDFYEYLDEDESIPIFTRRTSVQTDDKGYFSITLWCNEEGNNKSYYTCILPNNKTFSFSVPVGSTPIDIEVLRDGGITPENPQYKTLITYLQSLLGTTSNRDIFVTSEGDTFFLLQATPEMPHMVKVVVNGLQQNFGKDYNIDRNILNWTSAIALSDGWILEVYY